MAEDVCVCMHVWVVLSSQAGGERLDLILGVRLVQTSG